MANLVNFPIYGFVDEIFSFSEDNWRKYFKPYIYDSVQTGLEVTAGSGMAVNVSSGECHCGAVVGILNENISLDIDAGDETYSRIDTIAIQYLYGEPSTLAIMVIKGTPSLNPVSPTLSKSFETIWQIGIAQIEIPANAINSSQCIITDTRPIYGPIIDRINSIEENILSITTDINNINSEIISIRKTITDNIEEEMIATKDYSTGDYLIANGVLYKTISPIVNGENIIIGTNVIKTTITEQLQQTRFLRR